MNSLTFTPQEAARIIAICVEHGYDFGRMSKVQLFPHLCRAYLDGKDNAASFVANLHKINIFNNGNLKL